MNPPVARIYKNAESSPGLKKWIRVQRYLGFHYFNSLVQCLLGAFVFALMKPVLPEGLLIKGFIFGLVLIALKIVPRFLDMWIQSTYPNKLLGIELVIGSIISVVIGVVYAYLI
jgi:hypothetical protein